MQKPTIHTIFEPDTGTWQYIVADPATSQAVIIDPMLDFDSSTSRISATCADKLLEAISEHSYRVTRILETHAHADHLTASRYLQGQLVNRGQQRPDLCIEERIKEVQKLCGRRYAVATAEMDDAFDKTFDDNEKLCIGDIEAAVLHLPGHTPDNVDYVIGSNVFIGDSIFNADVGIQALLALSEDYRLCTGQDYPPAGREGAKPCCTVKEQREGNKHANVKVEEGEFVDWRSGRDAGLSEAKIIHQALQVNIRGGRLPADEEEGDRFLKVPVKVVRGVL